tara:strand:- start:2255 stop:2755 length:501 start_codon:yes stop_codon:yes gene_type:complete
VVACSAGNHAQGVALSCNKLKVDCKIIMPIITPNIKVNAVRNLGVEPILYGNNYDEAYIKALEISKHESIVLVHPYDDIDIIAGQGTIGKEITNIDTNIYAIFIPIGGGGLISGISVYIKTLFPHIKIIGVETIYSCAMKISIDGDQLVTLENINTFADGTAVKKQ